jgi:putative PIN family toxin of toxin-antitoxin system
MRFILDTNIWISYLLARDEVSTIVQLVHVCMDPVHMLIMPPEIIQELQMSITKYPYLRTRITQEQIDALVQEITQIAENPDSLQTELTRYVRDPKDDYLIAYGLIYTADYLVTDDADLLVLPSVEQLQIVRPAEMRSMLEERSLWSPWL